MKLDLHTHSAASDGLLTPRELLAQALAADVELFSITDHDTLAAYDEIGRAPMQGRTRIIAGVELSADWRGRVVHILGYGFSWDAPALRAGLTLQRERREARAWAIGERLRKKGIEGAFDGARTLAGGGSIGRPHFARHLVATGAARSVDEAFTRWLNDRATAGIAQQWATLAEAVEWIASDGGSAVLAHPAKYSFTQTRLRELLADFAAAGGQGMEVVCGRQPPEATLELGRTCARFGLLASAGSDFHGPESWAPAPGITPVLPAGLTPLWAQW